MKKIAIALLSVTLISNTAFAAPKGKVVATYSGGQVTDQEIINYFKPQLDMQDNFKNKNFADFDPKMKEGLIKSYLSMKLIEQEAAKLGITTSKEFKEKVRLFQLQVKLSEQQMVQQELMGNYLQKNLTDKLVDETYNNYVQSLKGQEEIKTAHILVETEKEAKDIKEKLNKGEDFAKLAKEFSKDPTTSVSGGETGYFLKTDLVSEYADKAFAMKKNEISEPVNTQFGWHIIKLLDKRAAVAQPKDKMIDNLKNQLSRDLATKYMNELLEKAKLELKI